MSDKGTVTLSKDDLKDILSALVQEARKPAPESNRTGYEAVIDALQEAELPTGLQSLPESLAEGIKRGIILESDRALVQAYISAHRKEIADFQQSMEDRAATAQSVIEKKTNERWFQRHGCPHEHPKAAGGGTHAVFVRDNDVPQSPGYIYCQKCQGRFRPDEPLMRKLDPEAIFDTGLFNRLLQDCMQTGAEILG